MLAYADSDSPMEELRSAGVKVAIEQPSSCLDALNSKYCYPGHATFSSTVFLSLYEEEESFEQPTWNEEYLTMDSTPGLTTDLNETLIRPTIYHLLRLFDSIRGFHKGCLDLSGRHPQRYYNLQSQWNRYLLSFLSLETEIRSCGDLDAPVLGLTAYYRIVFNADRWRRFQLKWRLPESASYSQLLRCTQIVLRELKQNPVPQFQILRLTDLPSEVLDNIVGLASAAQSKVFSSTCHILNDIAQRHIFRTWRMKLHVPPHISPFNVEYSSVDLPTVAYYSRKDLEKNAEFILSTPHISRRIQRLVLTDEWWVSRRAHPHGNNPFVLGMDFYRSVIQIFGSVFKSTPSLSTLVLCNLEMNLELCRRISEISTLHTLELHLCHISRMVRRKLCSESAFGCPQVANLRIFMDSSFQETHDQWFSLLLCPQVRTLSIVQFGIGAFPTPDALFWMKCRLGNLERLSLDNIDSGDLAELTRFLTGNKMAGIHLTHFKLHMDWGMPDSEVMNLLLALRKSPIEVLVLEGLAEAEFVIFETIVVQYPYLIALTLVRRQNRNQHLNKLAIWPHSSWEYATYFRGFKNLRHFCWNFLTEYWDATPTSLLAFESDFQATPPTKNRPDAESADQMPYFDLADEVPYFLDSHWMALPFVAHCPTLESFSLMDRTIDMACRISRTPITGKLGLVPKYYPTHSSFSWNDQQWNTISSHWPILLPLTRHRGT
ncbi:hypothetical protein GALMADRAFT_225373 [Galerina marginata CBS 339.88]|uniref:F-box domain-containing protein n=1 Tax=Galerina marginata (strain CBS 339.88) TaxID=685588 RepID=A0A067TBI5_GALM3|nr:hypothetical protein GALMADRAFT_225373 [Galerina marginata CBS 339.88]